MFLSDCSSTNYLFDSLVEMLNKMGDDANKIRSNGKDAKLEV